MPKSVKKERLDRRIGKASEAAGRFPGLLEAAPDAMVVVDQTGRIVLVNSQTERLFGYQREELLGHDVEVLLPEHLRERHRFHRMSFLAEPRIRPMGTKMELLGVRKGGTEFPIEVSLSPIVTTEGVLVTSAIRDVSERKLADEAKFRLAAIVESSDDAIVSKNRDAIITSWNAGAQHIFGYTDQEVVGRPITILIPPEFQDEESKILEKLRAGEHIEHYETVRITKAGNRINVSLSISPIKDSNGGIVGFCKIARDISDRKRAELELCKANERLRLALEAGSAGGWDYDLKTGKNVWFGTAHAQLGMTPDETSGSRTEFWDHVHEDDRERVEHALQVAKEKREEYAEDVRVVWRDGTTHWLRSRGRFQYDANGEAERSLGISLDITENKQAEQALRASEERLRVAQQGARIGTFERDVRTGHITWSEGLESLYGLPAGSADGKTPDFFKDLLHPDDKEKVAALIQGALKTGLPTEGEWRAIWPDGSVHWIAGRWQVLMDDSGEPLRVVGANLDITERKLAEESKERFRSVFECSAVGMALVGHDGRWIEVNRALCEMLGYSEQELLATNFQSLTHPDDVEADLSYAQKVFTGQLRFYHMEKRYIHKQGDVVWVTLTASAVPDASGKVSYGIAQIQDITARKTAEESLRRDKEELRSLTGRLITVQEEERRRIARELHDDVSQKLALLSIDLEETRSSKGGLSAATNERLKEIQQLCLEISHDVHCLSHELHSSKLDNLGMATAIRGFCAELSKQHHLSIAFQHHNVPEHLPREISLCLFRVAQEALHNAIKYSGVTDFEVHLNCTMRDVQLMVTDAGAGFDMDAATQGSGLGLISMRERMHLVNGQFSVESRPGYGTKVFASAPLAECGESSPNAKQGRATSAGAA